MRVKICGITNYEDAKLACDYGADALGFVFYKPSPRFIEAGVAKKIIEKLPPFVTKVALFVNMSAESINGAMEFLKADIAQIHFDADEDFFSKLNCKYLPVVRAKEKSDIDKFEENYKIVDAYVPEYGGSGKRVALEWFENRDNSKIILAGGLTPENVFEVGRYGFYGVDVSSGVEERPGKKDKRKLRKFIELAKYGLRCG
ncbi:phosphoribosylanthranilate isomerase [Caminibacter pacificus]|uniref:N-(5'-phosphoribosyl)anthranilate isomerase n=1 Tax=Caminibacter pacificus TaxID=1424653 RepID=A0AAJ4RD27_9BACT|nr:phosphoribosylanthranilate isomerase [Caminibacter pacificus]QCI27669.1 phosphoribosylanthranilate isomerase [Caminibacter pacificus]ROR40156.1 phosphoribosylanthranilate isomerase [Caminibacter pacificus]